jgi:hypothetical protein
MVAIKLFSIMVNSMADERTNSTFTWFNSPIRGRQEINTLRDMIQVGQFYRVQEDGERSVYRPTVKFKKLDRETLKILQSQDDSESESDDSDDDGSSHAVAGCSDLPAEQSTRNFIFQVDHDIDLNSKGLHDLLDPHANDAENDESDGIFSSVAPGSSVTASAPKTTLKDVDWSSIRDDDL